MGLTGVCPTMTRPSRILLVLTSVCFIAAAALGTRVAFILNQQRKIPHQILATVPFEQETGNIAFALSPKYRTHGMAPACLSFSLVSDFSYLRSLHCS